MQLDIFDFINQDDEMKSGSENRTDDQIFLLKSLVQNRRELFEMSQGQSELKECQRLLPYFFMNHGNQLLRKRAEESRHDLATVEEEIRQNEKKLEQMNKEISQFRNLVVAKEEQSAETIEKKIRQSEAYREKIEALELVSVKSEEDLETNRALIEVELEKLEELKEELEKKKILLCVKIQEIRREIAKIDKELNSLRTRKSLIPVRYLKIRDDLANSLNLEPGALPFVAELLQVRYEEQEWEGTIEQFLRKFGLTILVQEEYCDKAHHYLSRIWLSERVAYYRVSKQDTKLDTLPALKMNSLVNKLQINPETPFRPWLIKELFERFDYHCCDTFQDFLQADKAITKNGQIKNNKNHHEKDDRYNPEECHRYIFGWMNRRKIQALEEKKAKVENEGVKIYGDLHQVNSRLKSQESEKTLLDDLLKIQSSDRTSWQQVDSENSDTDESTLSNEKSEPLKREIDSLSSQQKQLLKKLGAIELTLKKNDEELNENERELESLPIEEKEGYFPTIATFFDRLSEEEKEEKRYERNLYQGIQFEIDNKREKMEQLRNQLLLHILKYNQQYSDDPINPEELEPEDLSSLENRIERLEKEDAGKTGRSEA